jgi:hypothetical protein
MSPFRVHPGALWGVAALWVGGAVPVAAQDKPTPKVIWEVGAPKAGWCIHFLMEPESATKDLTRGHRLIPAREATGLPEPVRRLITEEPEYAEWVPAELCTYVAEAVWTDNRRFDRGDGGQPIAFLYWGISATGNGAGVDTGRVALRVFATNSSGLQRIMEIQSVPIDRVNISVKPVPETDDLQYTLKLEGATILFDGHPRADSTLTVAARTQSGVFQGNNNSLWGVTMSFTPTTVSGMAGSLRITGKHGLAKALNRSPIRLLGAVFAGGKGEVAFSR